MAKRPRELEITPPAARSSRARVPETGSGVRHIPWGVAITNPSSAETTWNGSGPSFNEPPPNLWVVTHRAPVEAGAAVTPTPIPSDPHTHMAGVRRPPAMTMRPPSEATAAIRRSASKPVAMLGYR